MDSKDFRRACMFAGGLALTAAAGAVMYGSGAMPAGLDVSMDIAQVVATIAGVIAAGGAAIGLLGLTPLVIKYGYKLITLVKQKLQEKYHMSSKEADKAVNKALEDEAKSKSSSRENKKDDLKKGNMKDSMREAYKRAAFMGNMPRRPAHNPAVRSAHASRLTVSNKYSARVR